MLVGFGAMIFVLCSPKVLGLQHWWELWSGDLYELCVPSSPAFPTNSESSCSFEWFHQRKKKKAPELWIVTIQIHKNCTGLGMWVITLSCLGIFTHKLVRVCFFFQTIWTIFLCMICLIFYLSMTKKQLQISHVGKSINPYVWTRIQEQ